MLARLAVFCGLVKATLGPTFSWKHLVTRPAWIYGICGVVIVLYRLRALIRQMSNTFEGADTIFSKASFGESFLSLE